MIKDIRHNLSSFYQPVSMPGGWTFDHVETLKFNHLYYYGKYQTGNKDAQGYYKFFHNNTKPACDIATQIVVGRILTLCTPGSCNVNSEPGSRRQDSGR